MKARDALREGALGLTSRPAITVGAMLAGAAAALALFAANAAATRLRLEGFGARAALAWLLGATWAALLLGMAIAGALSSLRANGEDVRAATEIDHAAPLRWLRQGTAVLSLWALERVLLATLALAAAAVPLRFWLNHPDASQGELALTVTLAAGGPLLVALIAVPAFRVALALAAVGAPAWLAFADGVGAGILHLASLWRLLALLFIATAPLWLLAIALGRLVDGGHGAGAAIAAAAGRGALQMVMVLWGYASVAAAVRALSTETMARAGTTAA